MFRKEYRVSKNIEIPSKPEKLCLLLKNIRLVISPYNTIIKPNVIGNTFLEKSFSILEAKKNNDTEVRIYDSNELRVRG